MSNDPQEVKRRQALAVHEMHKCLKATLHSMHKFVELVKPSMINEAQLKMSTMLTRFHGALEIAERTFPDPMSGATDTGRNDGPVALVQRNHDTGGARLFVHGVCVRVVGHAAEIRGLEGLAEMVNQAAAGE